MENAISEKMHALLKYVPFIDFLLSIDKQKYIKFTNIKKWIILKKKKYPLSDLNKIEQSIKMQYQNLLIENKVRIPKNISEIFTPLKFKEYVNLCSDDDDDKEEYNANNHSSKCLAPDILEKENNERYSKRKSCTKSKLKTENLTTHNQNKLADDSDDDVEIVSIDYINKQKKSLKSPIPSGTCKASQKDDDLNNISKDLLHKIDKLAEDEKKSRKEHEPEPIIYIYQQNNNISGSTIKLEKKKEKKKLYQNPKETDVLFQRRTDFKDDINAEDLLENSVELFKRRTDFENEDEVIVESLINNTDDDVRSCSKKSIETLYLDSDSENELNSNAPSTSKAASAALKACTNLDNRSIANKNGQLDLKEDKTADLAKNATNCVDVEKIDSLCDSIDLAFSENGISLNDLNAEMQAKETIGSSKENATQKLRKWLETALDDIPYDTIVSALSNVKNNSTCERNLETLTRSETPPPAPPVITSIPNEPLAAPFLYQQQNQPTFQTFSHLNVTETPLQNMPATSFNNQISNDVAPKVLPTVKLNLKDPRIRKQLKVIQNLPLINSNPEIKKSIMSICQSQAGPEIPKPNQQLQQSQQTNNNFPMYPQNVLSNKTTNLDTSKNCNSYEKNQSKPSTESISTISYGEYKRRKLEQSLEMERRREKEKREELRDKITSYLKPNEDQITNLWKRQKNAESKTAENISEEADINVKEQNEQGNNKSKNKKSNSDDKLNRIYRELHCSFKGFDQLIDYIPKPLEEKRLSSIQALNQIRNQLNSNLAENCQDKDNSRQIEKEYSAPHSIGLKRRSSIHALSAISEQLSDSLPEEVNIECSKRRKTIDEIIKPIKRCHSLRIESSESSSSENEDSEESQKLKLRILKNPGYVKLERISQEFISKHTKRKIQENTQNRLKVHLVKLNDKPDSAQKSVETNSKKLNKPSKLNNDCQMTERNTRFCALCTSKPSDLTNHYIRKHKTESYISRLDWSELDDLRINTPFAKLQPQTSNSRIERYAVECPFCKEELKDAFMNLYNHYASHTGEFAFQCSHCYLLKPYRADIQSHLLHSKTCRNSHVKVLYRYPPDAQCIYLHFCDICNFVQLNEANIYKHIREHHHSSKAIAKNVGKCILAAISDGPIENTVTNKTPLPTPQPTPALTEIKENANSTNLETKIELKFKVDDEDVHIGNEPLCQDLFEDNKFVLEEQLRKLHEENVANVQMPMTVIHDTKYLAEFDQFHNPSVTNSSPHSHLKVESLEITENHLQTPPRASLNTTCLTVHDQSVADQPESYSIYEKYRYYPETVNYLGLYKCMIDDCFYSTDCSEEMVNHLDDHAIESTRNDNLQCPYCIIPSSNISLTPEELVEHVRLKHQHMNFQCSLCCYRSCEASNVLIHQNSHHCTNLKYCKIYKCPNSDVNSSQIMQIDLNQLINKNVFKIKCKYCHEGFCNSNLLSKHLTSDHKLSLSTHLKMYSCIYCALTSDNMKQLRIHVASKHPERIPLIYDHNGQVNKTEDALTSLNVINLSEAVPSIEVNAFVNQNVVDQSVLKENADIKPDIMQLLQMNEETIKARLRKLTNHTGIAPDTLYRCPISSCGGFFSIFDLWLKHMKLRHYALECECPHCPTTKTTAPTMLALESFRSHFEEHRRHTVLCFYCTFSFSNEQMALQHAKQKHADFGTMRFEQIRINIIYSYFVMLQDNLFTQREEFINEFLKILEKRLKDMEENEKQLLNYQWPLNNSSIWIENFPKMLTNRKSLLRCLIRNCEFRSLEKEELFQHLLANHEIKNKMYCCSICNYRVEKCDSFEEIYNHIKIHSGSLFICAACSSHSSSHSKISLHIREQHAARDVAVVQLFKMDDQIFNKICIIFANDHLTFSTMRNCFCCPERNMSGNVLSLHLKRYHNLVLTYYCEKCKNFQFKNLEEVKEHFQQFHNQENIKLRCELASKSNLSVLSLNEFEVQISDESDNQKQSDKFLASIKEEPYDPDDDCVILLEADDVVIENSLKNENKVEEIPMLKCKSLNNLLNNPTEQQHAITLPVYDNKINNNNNLLTTSLTKTPYNSTPASRCVIVHPKPSNVNSNNYNHNNTVLVASNSAAPDHSTRIIQPNSVRVLGKNPVELRPKNNVRTINSNSNMIAPIKNYSAQSTHNTSSSNITIKKVILPNFNSAVHSNTVPNQIIFNAQLQQPNTSNHPYV